jgi:hypothetical protein
LVETSTAIADWSTAIADWSTAIADWSTAAVAYAVGNVSFGDRVALDLAPVTSEVLLIVINYLEKFPRYYPFGYKA